MQIPELRTTMSWDIKLMIINCVLRNLVKIYTLTHLRNAYSIICDVQSTRLITGFDFCLTIIVNEEATSISETNNKHCSISIIIQQINNTSFWTDEYIHTYVSFYQITAAYVYSHVILQAVMANYKDAGFLRWNWTCLLYTSRCV